MSKIVLCVDDSATMQQVADITFRGTEFTYVGARSYDEGLDKARSQKPILILADSLMPGQKSGYDLCLALKSDSATANIPVAILVGNSAPYDSARGAQVGADANLPKPWDTQTMLEKVVEVIGKAATGVAKPGQTSVAAAAAPAAPASVPPASTKSAPAAASASATMPPRSATIMGMPTIKMPAGNTQPATPGTPAAATPPAPPAKTTLAAVPPFSPGNSGAGTSPVLRAPAPPPPAPVAPPPAPVAPPPAPVAPPPAPVAPPPAPVASPPAHIAAPPAPVVAPPAPVVAPPAPVAASASSMGMGSAAAAAPAMAAVVPSTSGGINRAPMVSGTPTKRSLIVERALAKMAARLAEASGLDPGSPELVALLKLSTEVVERIVWEVVPDLAEQIIRENLHDLTARRS
ncbi:MAG TPA: response regulator [Kofleriaceae bacterium]|nr:response regulator [Kofleriaceae bacterium]